MASIHVAPISAIHAMAGLSRDALIWRRICWRWRCRLHRGGGSSGGNARDRNWAEAPSHLVASD